MEERNKNLETEFIQKFGFDNVMQLDKETNGIFSRKIHRPDNTESMLMTLFANEYNRTKEIYSQKETNDQFTYAEFKRRIYEYLVEIKNQGIFRKKEIVGNIEDYDFVQGSFREQYPDIFIDEEISPELKRKYYKGLITAQDIKENPELFEVLKNKRIEDIFKARLRKACLLDELSKEDFLKICRTYGKYLDNEIVIDNLGNFKFKYLDMNVINMKINQKISDLIRENKIEYDDTLPESFKKEQPQLFLSEEMPEVIKDKFYKGELEFEDIRNNEKLYEDLMYKDLDVGFKKMKNGESKLKIFNRDENNRGKLEENWARFSKEKLLELAYKYGKYLEVLDCDIFGDTNSLEERVNEIEKQIEEKILSKEIKYDETVPAFFKNKHPELILDEGAPEELKKYYYDYNSNEENQITFEIIDENPLWLEYLLEKDLTRAFPEKYNKYFRTFDNLNAIKLGAKDIKSVDAMVEKGKEETLKKWYYRSGGAFIPCSEVMENIQNKDIDKYLANSRIWKEKISELGKEDIDKVSKEVEKEAKEIKAVEYSQEDMEKVAEILNKARNKDYESLPNKPKKLWDDPVPPKVELPKPEPVKEEIKKPMPVADIEPPKPEPETAKEEIPITKTHLNYLNPVDEDEIIRQRHEKKERIPIYDSKNMKGIILRTIKRMDNAENEKHLLRLKQKEEDYKLPESQKLMNCVAREYEIEPENLRIMADAIVAIIYAEYETKIELYDVYTEAESDDMQFWEQWAQEEHAQKHNEKIEKKLVSAIKQLQAFEKELDLSKLKGKNLELINKIIAKTKEK